MKKYALCFMIISVFSLHCDLSVDDGVGNGEPGSFEATVTGVIQDNFFGTATYSTFDHPETGESVFILFFRTIQPLIQATGKLAVADLQTNTVYNIIEFIERDGDEFTTDLDEGEFFARFFNVYNPAYSMEFDSKEGEIIFEEVQHDRLKGSIQFVASGVSQHDPGDRVEIFFSGTFQAAEGEIGF